jgi:phosphomannomutase
MLTFTLAGGAVVTLRTSGTEPKVKCYCHVAAPTRAAAEAEMTRVLAVSMALLGELAGS